MSAPRTSCVVTPYREAAIKASGGATLRKAEPLAQQ